GHGSDFSERLAGPPCDAAGLIKPRSDSFLGFSEYCFVRPATERLPEVQLKCKVHRLPQATLRHDDSNEPATGSHDGRKFLQQLLQRPGTDTIDAVEIGEDEVELFVENGFVKCLDVDVTRTDLVLKRVLLHLLLCNLQHLFRKVGSNQTNAAFTKERCILTCTAC